MILICCVRSSHATRTRPKLRRAQSQAESALGNEGRRGTGYTFAMSFDWTAKSRAWRRHRTIGVMQSRSPVTASLGMPPWRRLSTKIFVTIAGVCHHRRSKPAAGAGRRVASSEPRRERAAAVESPITLKP
jgi:hypothetical protein